MIGAFGQRARRAIPKLPSMVAPLRAGARGRYLLSWEPRRRGNRPRGGLRYKRPIDELIHCASHRGLELDPPLFTYTRRRVTMVRAHPPPAPARPGRVRDAPPCGVLVRVLVCTRHATSTCVLVSRYHTMHAAASDRRGLPSHGRPDELLRLRLQERRVGAAERVHQAACGAPVPVLGCGWRNGARC